MFPPNMPPKPPMPSVPPPGLGAPPAGPGGGDDSGVTAAQKVLVAAIGLGAKATPELLMSAIKDALKALSGNAGEVESEEQQATKKIVGSMREDQAARGHGGPMPGAM